MELIVDYEKQVKRLKEEALKMCWYMRGGITYDEAMALSFLERELINDIVKNNMDVTQKSGLPFF
jgi:hypothetical protein